MKTYAIIPAGGSGKRTSQPLPKQFIKCAGKELIVYTLEVFQNCSAIDSIVVSVPYGYIELLQNLKMKHNLSKVDKIVIGGEERQNSVYNALSAIDAFQNDIIVVHDAARPLLSERLLLKAIAAADEYGSAATAIKARDTLLRGEEFVEDYFDRSGVFYVQTPQVFKYGILSDSFKKASEEQFTGTDESMLVRRASYQVKIVEGEFINFKITTDEDITFFERVISQKVFKNVE